MSTDLNIEMVTKLVEQKLQNKPVDKILDEPKIVTYGILEDQVAVAASAIKKSQWGGKHSHERGQIPFNHIDNNQHRVQTGKTRRH